ncbi:MAG: hypothetical protein J5518_02040 [Lachnospiraceae bacterium]|nr:hypothetical protein [Lachnospiraceae bacterium]
MNRKRNVLYAILLIVLAVCLILWKLNVFNLPASVAGVSTWGLIVSVIMLLIIIHSVLDLNFAGVFIPLAVIGIVFDKPLGITAISPGILIISAVLLTIAFEMLFSKHKHFRRHRFHGEEEENAFRSEKYFESTSVDDEMGHIVHTAKFGSATKYVRTSNLISADLSTQFGEMSVFFDGAQAPGGRVNIHSQVSFGEMDLYIPKDWHVENRVSVTLGHCDDRCRNDETPERTVTCVIDGSVAFGELKLIRV